MTDKELQRCLNCTEEFTVVHIILANDGKSWRQVEARVKWCPFCRSSLIPEDDLEAAMERFVTRNADTLAKMFTEAFQEEGTG